MLRVLVTGMSGTGKSTALESLRERGHKTVDADGDQWSHWARLPDGTRDWVWREDAMTALLTGHRRGKLFVAGCAWNQAGFYQWFDHVALLSAPAEVLLDRVANRTNNTFGKSPEEREKILRDLHEVESLLRNSATIEIDASAPLDEVVRQLDELSP
ncbi:AAA family ATPase [Streptosporangium sp. KLBMP 9127]|nr:AAA family ATPase [Streptosporangium sp. KLBMP 9127]